MFLKTILLKSIQLDRPFFKTKYYRFSINLKKFSTQPEPIPLNIPRRVNEETFRYTENNHAYKILRTLPNYKTTITTRNIYDESIDDNDFNTLLSKNWRLATATEIVNAFKSACKYSRDHSITLSDTRFDKLVDGLMDKCQDLTDDELIELLEVIQQYPKPLTLMSHNFHDIWSALDDMCCRRHQNWNITKLLLVMDRWYLLGLTKYLDYMKDCIKRISRKARHLTASELVHTFFIINVTRRRFDMFEFECQLEKYLHQLTLDEMGIVCMSFFKTKTPIKGTFLIGQIIDRLLEETDTVHEITLSAILKAVRLSPHLPLVDQLQLLSTKLIPVVNRISLVGCIHIALLGSNSQFSHPGILTKISQKFLENMSDARIKDLERLTFALSLVNFTPELPKNIYEEIRKELHNPARKAEIMKFPRCLSCCVHYLGLKEIFDYELIDRVLNPEFIQQAYGKDIYNIGREILFLDSSVRIECPDYKGRLLDDTTRSKLTKWSIERKPGLSSKLSAAEKLMLDVQGTLEILLGKDYVFMDCILPHSHKYDYIVCKDKNGVPLKLDHLKESPLGKIREAEKDGNTWYAIIPAGWNSYVRDTVDPTGVLSTKIRELKKLGYTPIMIPWHEFTWLKSHQKEDYIKNKLNL